MQIRRRGDDQVVGVAILVSATGLVATCVHVVRSALAGEALSAGMSVNLRFPALRSQPAEDHEAHLIWWSDENADDAALLQTASRQIPRTPTQVAILGDATESRAHPFQSYGYAEKGLYGSGYVDGRIMGPVDHPPQRRPTRDPIELRAEHVLPGVSGAAVLDQKRNLVVGLIMERWGQPADSRVAWAVDAAVFVRTPFAVRLHGTPEPLRTGTQPWHVGPVQTTQPERATLFHGAPPLLPDWTGREEHLKALSADWLDPGCRITGLIGLGGQGKSSLVRHWIDGLAHAGKHPDGVFWWSFYDRPDVEGFFAAALAWIAEGVFDLHQFPSATARAHLLTAHLSAGRYLFVLDGLEVLQFHDADRIGSLAVESLRTFLGFLAAPDHDSFVVLTSRIPPLDLVSFTTYKQHVLEGLTPLDGRALLRGLGLLGPDAVLEHISAEWDGHTLTLSLLGSYIAARHGGEAVRVERLAPPTAEEPHYARSRRVLCQYEELLDASEHLFLEVMSTFRRPVGRGALLSLLRDPGTTSLVNSTAKALSVQVVDETAERLVQFRLMSHDPGTGHYTLHPLIRAHFAARLADRDPGAVASLHRAISAYYVTLLDEIPDQPSVEDL